MVGFAYVNAAYVLVDMYLHVIRVRIERVNGLYTEQYVACPVLILFIPASSTAPRVFRRSV